MPNHIHGILFIVDVVGAKHSGQYSEESEANHTGNASPLRNRPIGTQPGSVWLITDMKDRPLGYFIVGDRSARAVIPLNEPQDEN